MMICKSLAERICIFIFYFIRRTIQQGIQKFATVFTNRFSVSTLKLFKTPVTIEHTQFFLAFQSERIRRAERKFSIRENFVFINIFFSTKPVTVLAPAVLRIKGKRIGAGSEKLLPVNRV